MCARKGVFKLCSIICCLVILCYAKDYDVQIENCTEKYISLQLKYAKLQSEHFKTLQTLSALSKNQTPKSFCENANEAVSSAPTPLLDTTEATRDKNRPTERTVKVIQRLPRNCAEVPEKVNGVYNIESVLPNGEEEVKMACEFDRKGSGWTVIQRRNDGSVNFNRNYEDYTNGFGDLHNEFWIGLETLHHLTMQDQYELLIVMEDWDNDTRYAHYDSFRIGSKDEKYVINVLGKYNGDAMDSFRTHLGEKFSTYDNDNDKWEEGNCASIYQGGWWFNRCLTCNLNGAKLIGSFKSKQCCRGIHWLNFRDDHYSLKFAQMMLRPRHTKKLLLRSGNSDIGSASNTNGVILQNEEKTIRTIPKNCNEATQKISGIYELAELVPSKGPVSVYCEFELHGGGWTVIQARTNGTANFNRPWEDYKNGFGTPNEDYWLGLDNIYQLINSSKNDVELLIVLEDYDNQTKYAKYSSFQIGNETSEYELSKIGQYSGNAGDSLSGHLTEKFSSYDHDNDKWKEGNCARFYQGAWWYNRCLTSNLNGPKLVGGFEGSQCCKGIHWLDFRGNKYSLKSARMMLRPKIEK